MTIAIALANIKSFIDLLVPIAITFALLFFIWGLAVFISKSGSEDGREEGRRKMLWGVITMFVIVAIWGLVWVVARTLNITPGANKAPVPFLPTGSSRSSSGGGTYTDPGSCPGSPGCPGYNLGGTSLPNGGSVQYYYQPGGNYTPPSSSFSP